jgi:hypothetical protein
MSAARFPTLILPDAAPAMLNPFLALGMAYSAMPSESVLISS